MMPNKILASSFAALIVTIVFLGCAEKKVHQETTISSAVDTSKYKQVDSLSNIVPRSALRDTILTITDDSVFALYYPNTGKVVMKLAKGDVCNITKTGRYDVVEGRGNFWIRVERYGGKGWIFGGQTSIKSDVWVFADGITELGHPYIKYKLNQLTAPNFSELYRKVQQNIKATEFVENKEEDEYGSRKVELTDDAIIVTEDDGLGATITETFKPGPATDSLQSILYSYTSKGGDYDMTFNHSLVIGKHKKNSAFVADFFGELNSIFPDGRHYVLTSDYDLYSGRLGSVHYTNVEIYSLDRKHVIERHRYANSAVEITGYPIFRAWDDGSFVASSAATFAKADGSITMEIFETYNRIKPDRSIEEKAFYITRYFTYNSLTTQFDESKREVIYQAK